MDRNTAAEIVKCVADNQKMDAIKTLCRETSMDLAAAHRYLMSGMLAGKVAFNQQLRDDFVQSPSDELVIVRSEINRLSRYADELEDDIQRDAEGTDHQPQARNVFDRSE